MALSLVPIPVAGMLTALALAPLLRLNLPATYLGTAVINPVTGTAFYFAELWVGARLAGVPIPGWDEIRTLDAGGWIDLAAELSVPFALGALTLVLGSLVTVYPLLYVCSRHWQARGAPEERGAAGSASKDPRPESRGGST